MLEIILAILGLDTGFSFKKYFYGYLDDFGDKNNHILRRIWALLSAVLIFLFGITVIFIFSFVVLSSIINLFKKG